MNKFLTTTLLCMGLLFATCKAEATTPVPTRNIALATKKCEADVTKLCVTTNCNAFCNAAYKNSKKLLDKCQAECTPDKRCKLKPLAGMDDAANRELDAQNREQLIACIAQVRDPEGTQSGRRMQDWTTIETPSWTKLMTAK
jgi:hypothetical protein